MSTKCSIRYEVDDVTRVGYHLYTEVFDDENVFLEMNGFHFEASSLPDITLDNGNPRLVVKLPVEWAKKLKLIDSE
jgi:hypothetical protein